MYFKCIYILGVFYRKQLVNFVITCKFCYNSSDAVGRDDDWIASLIVGASLFLELSVDFLASDVTIEGLFLPIFY